MVTSMDLDSAKNVASAGNVPTECHVTTYLNWRLILLDKPFVKLFRTPRNGYFLDVNKNDLIPISDESYNYLEVILNNEGSMADLHKIPEELIELESEGYLQAGSVVKEIRHPYVKMMPTILERNLSNLILQITQDCNFRCSYCTYSGAGGSFQRTHTKNAMSWDTAKKAIDFFWSRSVDSNNITISFYGGEPLLGFELIKKVVEYSKRMFSGKRLVFTITSNGTLLDDEKIRYLDDLKCSLMLSLDGTKEINDKYRVFANGGGTYDTVMQSIQRIKEIAPSMLQRMRISMVLMPESDYDLNSNIRKDCDALSDVSIIATAVDYDEGTPEYTDDFVQKAEYHIFLAFLAHYGRVHSGATSPVATLTVDSSIKDISKFEKPSGLRQEDAPSGPCIPGQTRLFINVHGEMLPCERVNENSAAMAIGAIDKGFDINNVNRFLEFGNITKDNCINCWCFRYCDLCAKRADDGSKDLSGKRKLSFCNGVRTQAINKIEYYLLLKEIPVLYQEHIRRTSHQRNVGDNI